MLHDDILKRLERTLDRRTFLRGSSLAAVALIGAAAAPLTSFAQEQEQQQGDKKKDTKDAKKDEKKDDKKEKEKDPDEALFDQADKDKETKIDAKGREYRSCPQCGYNMYRQGRTWTCENCGYSYVE